MTKDKEFMKVTNKDIFTKIEDIDKTNAEAHMKIISRLDRINGKVRMSLMIALGAISLTMVLLGFLFQHILMK